MLRVRMLGALEVELDEALIPSPATQRPWAVFAYLILAGRPLTRSELANRFWPDVLDQSARASLRSALWTLRRQLGGALSVNGDLVELEAEWVDVREFERLSGDDPERALALCRGDLLEGVEDEWVLLARQAHRERVIGLLEALATEAEKAGDQARALALTRAQLERDPLDEAVNRRLMIRLSTGGDRAGATRTYRELAERLRRELGVAPSPQTRELAATSQQAPAPPPPRRRSTQTSLPLAGRERELRELEQAWTQSARGPGGVAIVRGEAGVGKTRLLAELEARALAAGGRAARGAALDLGRTAPLSLWAELIRGLLPSLAAPPLDAAWPADLGILGVELPEHFAHRGLPGLPVAPDLQRTRLFEAILALLQWASHEQPLLLVLEDVHAADGPSLELAGYAARRVGELPVLMVLTRRPLPARAELDRLEHALRSHALICGELDLGPLSDVAVAALARSTGPLEERAVERVVDAADGNALLAVESARAMARGSTGVAASLRGLVRAAAGDLSSQGRELVEVVAVAARAVEASELPPTEDAALSDALDTGLLLSTDGSLDFRHALLREAFYAEIPDARRRALHRRWAERLSAQETIGRAAEIARQLRLAGADREAVPHLARAGGEARDLGALAEAAGYLEEALAIAPDTPELWLELGEIEAWQGSRERAEAAFERARAGLAEADRLALARAWLRQARAYHGPICVPRAVLDCAGRATELLGEEAEEELSEALAAQAWAQAVAGSVEEAERLLARLESRPGASDLRTYDVAHARALALMRRGRFEASYSPSITAGEAVLRADRPDLAFGCWANAAGAASAAGDFERALEFVDRGMEAVAGRGLQSLEVHLLAARSFVLRRQGRREEARAAGERERGLADRLGQPALSAMACHDLGLVALEGGLWAEAATLLAQALSVQAAPISRPLTRLALAEALARGEDPEGAERELRATVLEPVRPSDFPAALVPTLARVQGLAAQARGRQAEARARLEEAVAGWERLVDRALLSESLTTVLADLGRPVVGLIEPARELARTRSELESMVSDAVVH